MVALVGPPGSGASTQSAYVCSTLGCTALTLQGCIEGAVGTGSAMGERVSAVLSAGKALPHDLCAELLAEGMGGGSGPFVLEGWPEDGAGVEALEAAGIPVTVCVALEAPAVGLALGALVP